MTRFSAQDLDDEIEEKRELDTILMPNKGKRKIKEDSLVFETKIVDRDGNEITVGAIGMLLEEAKKLSWKHFKNYMVRFYVKRLLNKLSFLDSQWRYR